MEPVYLLPDLNSTTQLSILPVFKLSPQVTWDLCMESKLHLFHLLETDMISLPALLLLFLRGLWGSQSSKEVNWIIFPVIQMQTWGHGEWNGRPLCEGSGPDCSPSWVPLFCGGFLSHCRVSIWAALCKNGSWRGVWDFSWGKWPVLLLWNRDSNSTLPFKRGQREFSLINEKQVFVGRLNAVSSYLADACLNLSSCLWRPAPSF